MPTFLRAVRKVRRAPSNFSGRIQQRWLNHLQDESFQYVVFLSLVIYLGEVITHARRDELVSFRAQSTIWLISIIAFTLYTGVLGLLAWRRPKALTSIHSLKLQVSFLLLFFSLFFVLYGDPESNLSLAYVLPLILSARFLTHWKVVAGFISVELSMVASIVLMNAAFDFPDTRRPVLEILLTKSLLFACIAWMAARSEYLLRHLHRRNEQYSQDLRSLVEHGRELAEHASFDALFGAATSAVKRELNAETAALFLTHHNRMRRASIAGVSAGFWPDESHDKNGWFLDAFTSDLNDPKPGPDHGRLLVSKDDVQDDPRFDVAALDRYKLELKSRRVAHVATVTLGNPKSPFGELRVINKLKANGELDPNTFTRNDREKLATFAAQLSLIHGIGRRERTLRAAFDVTSALSDSSPDVDERFIPRRIAVSVVKSIGYRASCVFLNDHDARFVLAGHDGLTSDQVEELIAAEWLSQKQLESVRASMKSKRIDSDLQSDSATRHWAESCGIKWALLLPLIHEQKLLGVLAVMSENDYETYTGDLPALEAFSRQATIAIANDAMRKRHKAHIEKLKDLSLVLGQMMSSHNRQHLFREFVSGTSSLLSVEDCSVFLKDPNSEDLSLVASSHLPFAVSTPEIYRKPDTSNADILWQSLELGETRTFQSDPANANAPWGDAFSQRCKRLSSGNCNSLIVAPLLDANNVVLGIVVCENKRESGYVVPFSGDDAELLGLVTRGWAISDQKLNEIDTLHRVNRVARSISAVTARESGSDFEPTLLRIVKEACAVTKADFAIIRQMRPIGGTTAVGKAIPFGHRSNILESDPSGERRILQALLDQRNNLLVIPDLNEQPDLQNDFTRAEGVRSIIAIRLAVQTETVGFLSLHFRSHRVFSSRDIEQAQTFAEMVTIALQTFALFSRMSTSVSELQALQKLTATALQGIELQAVLDVVVKTICEDLGFAFSSISVVDRNSGVIKTKAAYGEAQNWASYASHDLDDLDIQCDIVRSGRTEIVKAWDPRLDREIFDRFDHDRLIRIFAPIAEDEHGSLKVIATVEAGHERIHKHSYTQGELDVLNEYLKQVSLVIRNARLLSEARAESHYLAVLHEMSRHVDHAIAGSDISEVVKSVVSMANQVAGEDTSVAILMRDQASKSGKLKLLSEIDPKFHTLISKHLVVRYEDHQKVIQTGIRCVHEGRPSGNMDDSSVCLPLQVGGEVIGVLCMIYHHNRWSFDKRDIQLLDLYARWAAIAIANAIYRGNRSTDFQWLSTKVDSFLHSAWMYSVNSARFILEDLCDEASERFTYEQRGKLQIARERLDRVVREASRIRDIRRLDENAFESNRRMVDLGSVVEDSYTKFAESLESDATANTMQLSCDSSELMVTCYIDPSDLERVLEELLSNALRFTGAGGTIRLSGAVTDEDAFIHVIDNGRGIPAESLEAIFDRHSQLTPYLPADRAGSGQGLYLARKLIEFHHGKLWAVSDFGKGSIFTIRLPISREEIDVGFVGAHN